jgi:hypothetical protein
MRWKDGRRGRGHTSGGAQPLREDLDPVPEGCATGEGGGENTDQTGVADGGALPGERRYEPVED